MAYSEKVMRKNKLCTLVLPLLFGTTALGDGRYFSAQDKSGLAEAVENALQIPYSVFDSSGALVAEGLVGGEPVELERGMYRVAVKTSPQRDFEDVEIQGEDEVVVQLD